MQDADSRLDRMIQLADETGLTLDEVVRALARCPYSDFLRLSGNPSALPLYIQSKVRP